MVNYFELGADKKLNDIVIAGSHDAGITAGKDNVMTQYLDIGGQAKAGVRVFDLRVAAATVKGASIGGDKVSALKAFHADGMLMKNEKKERFVPGLNKKVELERTKLRGGAFGEGLSSMLMQARNFVRSDAGSSEFLILKFDKCTNWPLIAETCIEILGDSVYTRGGNLNTTKLRDLSGKVIVLFSNSGMKECKDTFGPWFGPGLGILTWKNLYDKKTGGFAYDPEYVGLQYYGKGGTDVKKIFSSFSGKISENEKKQKKLMEGAKMLGNPNIMGMMYWTTTGISASIRERDAKMWEAPNVQRMRKLWKEGLEEYSNARIPYVAPKGSPAIGAHRKRFMPNIVMIDFADDAKCQQIRDLNDLSPSDLARL